MFLFYYANETVNGKCSKLIRANIYLSIFNIESVLHLLNYSIKVSCTILLGRPT